MRNQALFCIFIIAFLVPQYSFATRIDSLKQLLLEIPEEGKAKIYNFLAKEYFSIDLDSVYFFTEQSLILSKKYKNEIQEAHSYRHRGLYHAYKSEFNLSISSYDKAIVLFKSLNEFRTLTHIYNNVSIVLSQEGKYEKGLEYLFEGLTTSEQNNYSDGIILSSQGIGDTYRFLEQYDKAEEFLKRALELEKQNPNSKKNLATLYYLLGVCASEKNNYELALDYYNKMFDIELKRNNYRNLTRAKNGISRVYSKKGNHKRAIKLAKIALSYAEKTKDRYLISSVELNIGNEYMLLKQYRKAISEIEKGLENAKPYPYILWKRNAYYDLVKCYDSLHDYKNALLNYQIYDQLDDSLKMEESRVKIADLETKYETEKKEKQIKILNQEVVLKELKINKNRNALIFSASIFALLLLSAIGYFLYLRQKQKNQEIVKKQLHDKQLLATIINTEDKERKRFASDLHDGLGPLLSSIKLYLSGLKNIEKSQRDEMIEYSNELIDESIKSVRVISNNILPVELTEKGLIPSIISFRNKIQHSTNIDIKIEDKTNQQKLELSNELILYRVIQELINNSIKHSEADKINIEFRNSENEFTIVYEDNGKGFDLDSKLKEAQGIGLKNIYERIESLQGNLEFTSNKNSGTKVKMQIKT